GNAIERAAEGVVQQSTQLDDFVDHTVSTAAQAMSTQLAAAAAGVSARVEVAHADAELAQSAARRQILCISIGIVLVLLISGWLTSRAISRPIRSMTRAVQAIAAGDTDVAIGFAGRRDEVGVMASALEVLRGVAQDAFVKREMIRQFPMGMMMAGADDELRITFINPEAERLLERVHDHLPAAPSRLSGESLLIFYPDRESQRAVLTDPARLPDRARVRIGDETFDLMASAITDRSGAYVGPMVTWHRITAQVRLVEKFEQTVGQIAQVVGSGAETMQATARAMTETANDAGVRSAAVAAASDQAATNVSAVAASAEELASSVSEIARQVMESARIAGQAVSEAGAADRRMTALSDAATQIGTIVKLIGDIAGRTNLLALNATIEAARAGEAGRGFAVVASEVKTLATQTARATEDISAQIAAMQSATAGAVETLRSIGATIERINEIATAIAGATEQQGAATREIARAVQQAAAGTAEVTSNIARVAQAVDGTSGQAGETLAAATEVATQSERLRLEAERFLAAVQEAA
ncbi:MAG: methyl-accepting chemotaxis protein, partial [Acetobacteraceae bacterium]